MPILDLVSLSIIARLARPASRAHAAAAAARIVARRYGPDACVLTLFPDGFERYLGKGVFENL
ncbi:MAG TPA: hypothetical protein VFK70_20760 [Vicinamibacteria bacterium]|nr:hypothetical protein [Vicinamibacteria bacterium]